jgi:hypothetical protein
MKMDHFVSNWLSIMLVSYIMSFFEYKIYENLLSVVAGDALDLSLKERTETSLLEHVLRLRVEERIDVNLKLL